MHWIVTIDRAGVVETKEGYDMNRLQLLAQYAQGQKSVARVSMTVGRSTEFGALKVSATVSVDCPQTDEWVGQASQVALAAAVDFVNAATTHLDPGLQQLPRVPLP